MLLCSGKEGYTLLLISPQEMPLYKRLCRNLQKDDGIADFVADQSYINAVAKRVRLARDIDALVHEQKKVNLVSILRVALLVIAGIYRTP